MSRKRVSIRPRGNGTSGVTLFPFLAVLLCTMGALIMLLVVIARNVREQAEQTPPPIEQVETPPETPVEVVETIEESDGDEFRLTVEQAEEIRRQIEMDTEEALWFAEGFSASKAEAEKTFAEARAWLAAAEKESQRIKDEIERLGALAKQLERTDAATPTDVESLKQLLALRQRQRREAEEALARLRKEAESAAKSYAIIPYRGTGGTYRRPIYIECRDGKVIIQPEGIELTEADFLASDRPDNPLDAALRVVRQYYAETDQIQRGTEPYPLIVVRPSGVEAYGAARKAMGSWINEFGYELIDEDWTMQYPAPSEELRQRLEKQLDTSRHRLQGYLAAMRAQQQGMPRRSMQYRVDSKGAVQPLHSPEESAVRPGFGRGGERPRNGGARNAAPGTVPPNGNAIENDALLADGVYRPNGSLAQTGIDRNPATMFPPGLGSGGEKVSDLTPTERLLATTPGGVVTAPNGNDSNLVGEETLYGMKKPESLTEKPAPSTSPGRIGQAYGSDAAGTQPVQPNGQPTSEGPGRPGYATTRTPNPPNPPNPMIGLTPDSSGMPVLGATVSTNPDMNVQPTSPERQAAPRISANQRNEDEKPLHAQRPNDWALRDRKPFSAAVSRNVRIQCESDKFVLPNQPGLIGAKVVPIGPSVSASTEQLVLAIWDYMDSWGIAGEKYYWRPVLQVKITPGGEQRFEELRWLLRDSGFVLEKVE